MSDLQHNDLRNQYSMRINFRFVHEVGNFLLVWNILFKYNNNDNDNRVTNGKKGIISIGKFFVSNCWNSTFFDWKLVILIGIVNCYISCMNFVTTIAYFLFQHNETMRIILLSYSNSMSRNSILAYRYVTYGKWTNVATNECPWSE